MWKFRDGTMAGTSAEYRRRKSGDASSAPIRQYFSRQPSSKLKRGDLPCEDDAIGYYSIWGVIHCCVFLVVPFAYLYIALILLRELCMTFPDTLYRPMQLYAPFFANLVSRMKKSSLVVEVWCWIEALFFVLLKFQIRWLQSRDPLEASLASAPMMEMDERRLLWTRMLDTESDDPGAFISGWFFDQKLEHISRYDVRDFVAWSMFEGRNQEHLTGEELTQLEEFVEEIEQRIAVYIRGKQGDQESEEENIKEGEINTGFRFHESTNDSQPTFFTNLYERYKQRYEQYRCMIETADFRPVQDFRNFMAEAEENTLATVSHMCENAYNSFVSPGSHMDKKLAALGHATHVQLSEAWSSMKGIRERLETAEFLSSQRKRIIQKLNGYRMVLKRMREMSASVPSRHMASLMRKITECNEAMESIENLAMDAFVNATGFAKKNLLGRNEPQRYAKYSHDPLNNTSTYPLGMHLFILGATEVPLRIMMRNRGFRRHSIGRIAYYYHPGSEVSEVSESEKIPIVFVHGIGIGLIAYIGLIDAFMKSGRPLLLPEIPYVSGFRPWEALHSALAPSHVCSTLIDMLATHGYLRGSFVGHSFGTSWLSYMCKYASKAVASVVFIDPICFCLHVPRLTKKFVYHRPDVGSGPTYLVRTDLSVNWTIQRSFPWAWIILFKEQITAPCAVFLSDRDLLVPAEKVEDYLRSKNAPVLNFLAADIDHFVSSHLTVTVFRGEGHGQWTTNPSVPPKIALCLEALSETGEYKNQ